MTLNNRNKRTAWKAQKWRLSRAAGMTLTGIALGFAEMPHGRQAQAITSSEQGPKPENKSAPPLERQIHHQVQALPFYSVFDWITCSFDGKKVTLSGHVLRPTLKSGAVSAVKSIEGVDAVTDEIEVLPKSPADDDLRRTIYRAIFEDPSLAPYAAQQVPAIHIIVKNGSVTLEGRVKSPADRNLAAARVSNAANATELKNNLAVQSTQPTDQHDVR